jgi:hypothetical protein
MKTQFDKEHEAQKALNVARSDTLGFCPVIKDACANDCVCYYEGSVRIDPFKKHWNIYYPSCQHVLISGEISVT